MKKQKEALQVVMVEHIGDTGNWEWYDVVRDSTPKEQVIQYMQEQHGLDDIETEQQNEMVYGVGVDVRAYYIFI